MVDLKGRSPAMRAAEFGHIQALTLLAEADTDLSSKETLCSLLLPLDSTVYCWSQSQMQSWYKSIYFCDFYDIINYFGESYMLILIPNSS